MGNMYRSMVSCTLYIYKCILLSNYLYKCTFSSPYYIVYDKIESLKQSSIINNNHKLILISLLINYFNIKLYIVAIQLYCYHDFY